MLKRTYTVTIDIEVYNVQALYAEAMKRCLTDAPGYTRKDASEMLRPGGKTDIGACFQMVLDPGVSPPGTSILQSAAEALQP